MESRKRKSNDNNFENIDLKDYKEIDLDSYRDFLHQKLYDFNYSVVKKKEEIKEVNMLIVKKCKETTGHKWVSEREPWMYGERFTYCEHCRVDYYDSYMH